jgi:hypothetical protein
MLLTHTEIGIIKRYTEVSMIQFAVYSEVLDQIYLIKPPTKRDNRIHIIHDDMCMMVSMDYYMKVFIGCRFRLMGRL